MFSSSSSHGDLEKLRGDISQLLQQQVEMKGGITEMKEQISDLTHGQHAIRRMLEDVADQLGCKRRPEEKRVSVDATNAGTGLPHLDSSMSGRASDRDAGGSERQSKVMFSSPGAEDVLMVPSSDGDGGAGGDHLRTQASSTSLNTLGSRKASISTASDDEEASNSDSDEDDDGTRSARSANKRRKAIVRMRQHDSWEKSKIPNRRFVQLGFDIFSSSVHADIHTSAEHGLRRHGTGPRPAQLVVKEFRRFCGSCPHPRKFNLERLVMSPSSNISLLWTMLEGLLLISDFIMVPMLMFDDDEGVVVGPNSPWMKISDNQRLVSIIFWSLDFPLSFFKGYIDRNGERVCRPRKVAYQYIVSGAPLDVPLLVIEYITFFLADNFSEGRLLRVLRYSRSLKAGKLRRLTRRLLARVKRPEALAVMYMLGHLFGVILMCHIFGCLWYGVGSLIKMGNSPQWTDFFGDEQVNPPGVDNHAYRYFTSLRWSLAQLGFGDSQIVPANWLESLFAVVFSVICVITMTHLIGLIITSMIRLQDGKRELHEKETQLRDYLRQNEVSFDLQDRIWQVLREVHKEGIHRTPEESVELIQQLPNSLEIELRAEVFVPTLTYHPFFGVYGVSGADPHAMYNIVRRKAVEVKFLEAKQELFSEHESASSMWFVVQGAISYRYKHEPLEAGSKEWIGEAALWLAWRYVGTAVAKVSCDLMELFGEKFREIVQADLPQAQRYAKAFLQCAMKNARRFHDMMPDRDSAYMMAQDVFAPASAFALQGCVPIVKKRLDEWKPAAEDWQENWTTPWSESHSLSSSALISTMMTEMKRDIIMVFQTLFSQNLADRYLYHWPGDVEKEHYERRVLFLKRLIIVLGMCHVSCTDEDNSTELQSWPYPLASVICHGGRSMLRLQGVQPREVINWLVLGDKDGNNWERTGVPPGPMYTRLAASHSVKADPAGHLNEVKLKGVAGATGRGHNLGMDLPLGGLGNPTPKHPSHNNMVVGPSGVPYKWKGQDCQHVKDFQHGHLYLRWDEFGTKAVKHLVLPKSGPENMLPMQRRGSLGSILSIDQTRDEDPTETQETVFIAELAAQMFGSNPMATPVPETRSDSPRVEAKPVSRPPLNQKLEKVEDLENCLPPTTETDTRATQVKTEHLFKYTVDRKELMLNQDEAGKVEGCRGVMVHLTIELEGLPGQEDTILAHLGAAPPDSSGVVTMSAKKSDASHIKKESTGDASAAPPPGGAPGAKSSKSTPSKSPRVARATSGVGNNVSTLENIVPDCRVVSVLCRYDGLWLPTMLQYVQRSFQLGEAAMEKIYQGLSEEVYLGLSEPAPTINHHHVYACGDALPLEYDALYLKSRLKREDMNVLEKFCNPGGSTRLSDDWVFISGLGSGIDDDEPQAWETGMMGIKREWAWLARSEAEEKVKELNPSPTSIKLRLESKDVSLGSLLFGIENSAPLKEDLFGGTHTASAKSKETSAFGRRKWRDFRKNGRVTGQPPAPVCLKVPAELGGIQMVMTRAKFEEIMTVCEKMDFASPSVPCNVSQDPVEEKDFFQRLLCADASTSENLILSYASGNWDSPVQRPSLISQASSGETQPVSTQPGSSKEQRPPNAFGVPRLLRNNSRGLLPTGSP